MINSIKTYIRPNVGTKWWFEVINMSARTVHIQKNYFDTGKILTIQTIYTDPLKITYLIQWKDQAAVDEWTRDTILTKFDQDERDPYMRKNSMSSPSTFWF